MPGFHHSIAVLPFTYTVAIAVAYLHASGNDGLANGKEQNSILFQRKNGYDSFLSFTAVTEGIFYVFFAEQRNFITAEQRNGNGMVETVH